MSRARIRRKQKMLDGFIGGACTHKKRDENTNLLFCCHCHRKKKLDYLDFIKRCRNCKAYKLNNETIRYIRKLNKD